MYSLSSLRFIYNALLWNHGVRAESAPLAVEGGYISKLKHDIWWALWPTGVLHNLDLCIGFYVTLVLHIEVLHHTA